MDILNVNSIIYTDLTIKNINFLIKHEEIQPLYILGGAFRIYNKKIEQLRDLEQLRENCFLFFVSYVMNEKDFKEELLKLGLDLNDIIYVQNNLAIKSISKIALINDSLIRYEKICEYYGIKYD